MVDVATVTSVLTAAGFGGVVGGLVSQGKDRREARAAALKAVANVERTRWMSESVDIEVSKTAARDAAVALLLAQVPRTLTRAYLTFAYAAALLSAVSWEEQAGDVDAGAGSVHGQFSDEVRHCAGALLGALWHPWLGRPLAWWRLRGVLKRTEALCDVNPQVKTAWELARRRPV